MKRPHRPKTRFEHFVRRHNFLNEIKKRFYYFNVKTFCHFYAFGYRPKNSYNIQLIYIKFWMFDYFVQFSHHSDAFGIVFKFRWMQLNDGLLLKMSHYFGWLNSNKKQHIDCSVRSVHVLLCGILCACCIIKMEWIEWWVSVTATIGQNKSQPN